jgi:hypothetical protein
MEHTFKAYNMYTLNYRTKNLTTDGFNKITSYNLTSIRLITVQMKRRVKAYFTVGTDDSFFIADITIWFTLSHFWEML